MSAPEEETPTQSEAGRGNGCPEHYAPIAEYAFLSDAYTAALVGPDGAIEWMCAPRFDGPSVFARILDRERGGAFELAVEGADRPERRYLDGTLVLESRYRTVDGSVVVYDFLSLEAEGMHGRGQLESHHVLIRLVFCEGGQARIRIRIDARPDYARATAKWRAEDRFFVLDAPETQLWVSSDRDLKATGGRLEASFELGKDEAAAFSFRYRSKPIRRIDPERAERLLDATQSSWRAWSHLCRYQGVAEDLVMRSALVLKGLVFHPTGALLAAPTTSLPEEIGGERNWDYRYTWLRDSSLMLLALFRLGYEEEGHRYMDFLLRHCRECMDQQQILLGIGGEQDLGETSLEHLEGYACSRPVRIGNGAHDQLQIDTYGGVLDAALVYYQMTCALDIDHWSFLEMLVDYTCSRWREPDNGIWEVRGELRHFAHSKVMAWVCVDRGIRLAKMLEVENESIERWRHTREEIRTEVFERGYDAERGSFVQAYGDRAVDASALRFSLVGFLPGDDPRMISTIDCIMDDLGGADGLVRRYSQKECDDGLSGDEGNFVMCSFWLVSALVLAGRIKEAQRVFEAVTGYVSRLGLFAEEMLAGGEMLGNFPQAFTHLALIQAAANLTAADDRETLHAWAERR